MIFISSCSAVQTSASCGELTQFTLTTKRSKTCPTLRPGKGYADMSSSFNFFFLHGREELKGEVDRIRKGHIVERKISVVGQSSVQSHGSMFKCCFPPSPPGGIWVYCASWRFDEMATDMLCAQCPGSQLSWDIEGERDHSTTEPLLPKGLFPTTVILIRNMRADAFRPRWENPVLSAEHKPLFSWVLVQPWSTTCSITMEKCGQSWSVKGAFKTCYFNSKCV